MEVTMRNKKLYVSLGIAILLIGIAAFVAGKWINGGSSREGHVSQVTPAPEIPTTTPEVSGLLIERKDNTLILQTVSFDPGSGWRLGDSNAPMDVSSVPKLKSSSRAKQLFTATILNLVNLPSDKRWKKPRWII